MVPGMQMYYIATRGTRNLIKEYIFKQLKVKLMSLTWLLFIGVLIADEDLIEYVPWLIYWSSTGKRKEHKKYSRLLSGIMSHRREELMVHLIVANAIKEEVVV